MGRSRRGGSMLYRSHPKDFLELLAGRNSAPAESPRQIRFETALALRIDPRAIDSGNSWQNTSETRAASLPRNQVPQVVRPAHRRAAWRARFGAFERRQVDRMRPSRDP